jgi:hypothetical protein
MSLAAGVPSKTAGAVSGHPHADVIGRARGRALGGDVPPNGTFVEEE